MKKKLLALALIILAMPTLLVGCTWGNDDEDTSTDESKSVYNTNAEITITDSTQKMLDGYDKCYFKFIEDQYGEWIELEKYEITGDMAYLYLSQEKGNCKLFITHSKNIIIKYTTKGE